MKRQRATIRRSRIPLLGFLCAGCAGLLELDEMAFVDPACTGAGCLDASMAPPAGSGGSGATAGAVSTGGSAGTTDASVGESGAHGFGGTDASGDNGDSSDSSASGGEDATNATDAMDVADAPCNSPRRDPVLYCPGLVAPCSFEEFKAAAMPLGTGGYLVEGDLLIADDAELLAHYRRVYEQRGEAAHVLPFVRQAFGAAQRRDLRFCVDSASLTAQEFDRVKAGLFAAAAAWEQIADVRFGISSGTDGSCETAGDSAVFRVSMASGAAYKILVSTPQTDPSKRVVSLGSVVLSLLDEQLQALLRHALGHVLGIGHSYVNVEGCTSVTCSHLKEHLAWAAMRHTWCADLGPDMLYPGHADAYAARAAYGAPLTVMRMGEHVIAQRLASRELFRLEGGSWVRIGPASMAVVEVDGKLFRQSEDGSRIEFLDGAQWALIGGPASHIFRCGRFLCSSDHRDGTVSRYVGLNWRSFGVSARRYDSSDARAVRLSSDGQRVELYDEFLRDWVVIGSGGGGLIYGGPRHVYATEHIGGPNALGNAQRYFFDTGRWWLAAYPARQLVRLPTGHAALTPAGDAVLWYPDGPEVIWSQIGGEYLRLDGQNELYAVAKDGTVFVYESGKWSSLGAP